MLSKSIQEKKKVSRQIGTTNEDETGHNNFAELRVVIL